LFTRQLYHGRGFCHWRCSCTYARQILLSAFIPLNNLLAL
jgi:hypothetical protein